MDHQYKNNNQMIQTMQGFSDNHAQIKSILSRQESSIFEAAVFNQAKTGQISMNGSHYQFNGTHKSGNKNGESSCLVNTERKERDILKKSANYRVGKAIVEGSSFENQDKRSSSHDHWGQASSKNFDNFSSPPKKYIEQRNFVNNQYGNDNNNRSNRQLNYEGGDYLSN